MEKKAKKRNGRWYFSDGKIGISASEKREMLNYLKGFYYEIIKETDDEIWVKMKNVEEGKLNDKNSD